jgi:hypothetical protein
MTDILKTIGDISSIISLIGTGFSVSIWCLLKIREKHNEQRIKIALRLPSETFKLPYEIERKYFTRSELQGLLGVLPLTLGEDGKRRLRYELSFLNSPEFFAKLKAVQDGRNIGIIAYIRSKIPYLSQPTHNDINSIEIICYKNQELDETLQFDIEKMRKQCSPTTDGT